MAQHLRPTAHAGGKLLKQRLQVPLAGRAGQRSTVARSLENGAAFPHHDDFEAWWWPEDILLEGAPNNHLGAEATFRAPTYPGVPHGRRAPSNPCKYSLQEWRSFRARLVALEQERGDSLYLSSDATSKDLPWVLSSLLPPQPSTSADSSARVNPQRGDLTPSASSSSPVSGAQPPASSRPHATTSGTSPSSATGSEPSRKGNASPPGASGSSSTQSHAHSRSDRAAASQPSHHHYGNNNSSQGGMPRHRATRQQRPGKQTHASQGQHRDRTTTQQQRPQRSGKPAKLQSAPVASLTGPLLLSAGPGSWAHLLSHPEPGCLLLAKGGPDMAFFDRAVILLTSHSDSKGSVGFVLNKASPMRVSELQLASACPGFMETFGQQRLQIGGPMHMDHATMLHRYMGLSGANEVADKLYAGGLPDAVQLVEAGLARAHDFHLMLGVSGWAPRQLQSEIAKGMWHCVSASPDLVLPRKGSGGASADALSLARDGQDMWARILAIAAGPEAITRPWL